MSDLRQWVNLTKRDRFVEDEIVSIERVGHLHFECGFAKGSKPVAFKVRLVPIHEEPYSSKEKGRNARFKVIGAKGSRGQTGKVTKHRAVNIDLPAAGGNVYKIEAKAGAVVKTSSKAIETFRRLFYQPMTMRGVAPAPFLADVEKDFDSLYFVKLVKKGRTGTIPHRVCINQDNTMDFIKDVKAAYVLEYRRPFAMAIVTIESSATEGQKTVILDLKTYPRGDGKWVFDPLTQLATEVTAPSWLWEGLDDSPQPQSWLLGAFCIYEDAAGAHSETALPDANISLDPSYAPAFPKGGYKKLVVDLAGYGSRAGSTLVGARIELKTCEGFSGGFAYNVINLAVVCSEGWWGGPNDADEQHQTFVHEVGHKLGMVPDGLGRNLDRQGKQYIGHTHLGSHCAEGVTWLPKERRWSGVPGCVMFGADCTYDPATKRAEKAPKKFCSVCTKLMRRVDLGTGTPGFRMSVTDFR